MEKKKRIFRIYGRYMENGYRQEMPMDITFNSIIEAEKCVNYLNSNIKPCPYEDADGYIYDYFAKEDKTKMFETFED